MINAPYQHVVTVMPNPEQFAEWVRNSIKQLEMKPSNFLLEDKQPGSKNRVSKFLQKPEVISFGMATRLQSQILTTAVRRGVYLEPMEIKPLHKIIIPEIAE